MKNDLADEARRDKWPLKTLPFELSSNFRRHQNTIVPKCEPPPAASVEGGGRAHSSAQSLALSKSCMVKSMQSLTEYTKD